MVMPTKKDYEDLISRVDERTLAIPKIEKHLKEQNDNIAELWKADTVTRSIANEARDKAEKADKKSDKNRVLFYGAFTILAVAVIGALATILAQVLPHL